MATNPDSFNWREYDRKLFAAVALVFPLTVLLGFARTYYLKLAFGTPPLSRPLVHIHGALMTTWVAFFIAQVWLIRSKNHRTHMKFGNARYNPRGRDHSGWILHGGRRGKVWSDDASRPPVFQHCPSSQYLSLT